MLLGTLYQTQFYTEPSSGHVCHLVLQAFEFQLSYSYKG